MSMRGKCAVLFAASVAILSFATPSVTFASGSLSFTPASGSYFVGDDVVFRVFVGATESLTGTEGKMTYDSHAWSVDVSPAPGIGSWAVSPRVDNTLGVVDFSALLKTDKTVSEELFTVHAKALRAGKQSFHFDSAATISADGTGGNVLATIGEASFDISPRTGDAVGDTSDSSGAVLGASTDSNITISSDDMTDPTKWYSFASTTVHLAIPSGIRKVKIGITGKPFDVGYRSLEVPEATSSSANTTIDRPIAKLDEGEWYYHVTPDNGTASDTAHFRLAIDRTAPEYASPTLRERSDATDPHVVILFSATDTQSGIESITASWDGGAPVLVTPSSDAIELVAPGVGSHHVKFVVADKAGNKSEAEVPVTVTSLALPKVSLISGDAKEASPLRFRIEGIPGATAQVEFLGGTVDIKDSIVLGPQGFGEFTVKEHVLPGDYAFEVVLVSSNGASSGKEPAREYVTVKVSIIGYLGRNPALALAIIVTLLVGAFMVSRYLWRKYVGINSPKEETLALPAPRASASARASYAHLRAPQVVAPVAISRAPRVAGPMLKGDVVDLRRR